MDTATEQFLRIEAEELCSLNESGSTALVRRADGRILVRKEIDAESLPIYRLIRELIDSGQLRRVPRIADIVETSFGAVVMEEFVAGETIAQCLQRGVVFSTEEIRRIACMLCDDLYVLHKNGLVHRDLSSNNVVLCGSEPYILDFGIARMVRDGANADTRLLGTPGFAAPEQYGFSQSDPRTDVFSLGMLMRAMLINGERRGVEKYRVKRLSKIVSKCVRMEPGERYPDTSRLAAVLESSRPFREDLIRVLPGLVIGAIVLYAVQDSAETTEMAISNLLAVLSVFWLPSLIWMNFGNLLRMFGCSGGRPRWKRIIISTLITVLEFAALYTVSYLLF